MMTTAPLHESVRVQQERIERHRAESGVTEPDYGKLPPWLRPRVNALGLRPHRTFNSGRGCRWDWEIFGALERATDDDLGLRLFDHTGRLRGPDGEWLLVSEPYGLIDDLRVLGAVQAVADLLLLDFAIGPNSWWNPPSTIRIAWWPTAELTEHEARELLRRRGKEREQRERNARAELWRQEVEQTAQGKRR